MNNPIKKWLEQSNQSVSGLSKLLGINRSVLSSAINGNKQMPEKFIAYLKTNNPALLVAYYEYCISKYRYEINKTVFNVRNPIND